MNLEAALTGLDPAERALLDLSLRQRFSDAKLAELSGTDEPAIAAWRKAVVEELASEAGLDTSAGPEHVEDELRAAPASAWLSSASEVEDTSSRKRLKVLLGCLAVIAVVAMVVLITHGSSDSGSSTPVASTSGATTQAANQGGQAAPVALAPLAGSASSAQATAQLTGPRSLEVQVNGLPSPGKGAYRLWLFNSVIDSKPVGALSSGSGTIKANLPQSASGYRYLDVTRESSPTDDRYSGVVVLRTAAKPVLAGTP